LSPNAPISNPNPSCGHRGEITTGVEKYQTLHPNQLKFISEPRVAEVVSNPSPGGRLAFDIETISPGFGPGDEVDYENPDHFELAAVGLLYEAPDGEQEREVLVRSDPGPRGEFNFLAEVGQWLERTQPAEIVTYNGEFFDFPILLGRNLRAPKALGESATNDHDAINDAISNATSTDLADPAAEAYGYGTTLEDLIEAHNLTHESVQWDKFDHGLDADVVRPSGVTGPVTNEDIHTILETYLHTTTEGYEPVCSCNPEETFRLIVAYTLEDIEHLLTLADRRPFR
jgi:hypothetical protein